MPHPWENIGALPMERIHFVVIGGDVASAQHGADTFAIYILTAPLSLRAGAVKQSSVSPTVHVKLNAHVINIIMKIVSHYQFWHVLEYECPGLYGFPLCKQEHVSAETHPLCVMSSKTVPWEKHNDVISLICKLNHHAVQTPLIILCIWINNIQVYFLKI